MKKSGFGQGRFNGVGGKPEGDENIHDTAIRETKEEINVAPKKSDFIINRFKKDTDSLTKTTQNHNFSTH